MAERKLPIGIQSFQNLRENNYLYVDKTEYIAQLLNGKVYFLSRPRRFGKSLFLSTLAAYFQGQKELFKGLYLGKAEEELAKLENREAWQQYPVLYLDFARKEYKTKEDLIERLSLNLRSWEKSYGVSKITDSPEEQFAYIIEQIHEIHGKEVVVLIDEYDKPLYESLEDEELNAIYRGMLRGFYSVIKSLDAHIRFAFLTGITKFSKVSVFSGLNNLEDISLREDYAAICGITEKELAENFSPYIETLAKTLGQPLEKTLQLLKTQYDGYLFAKRGENVYNPFSLLNALKARSLGAYWFATGTSSFLVNYLKKARFYIPDLEGKVRLNASRFDSYRADMLDPLPILFHTGYLTIKGYDAETWVYHLGFPNNEVRYGFFENLLAGYAPSYLGLVFSVNDFLDAVRCGDVDAFMVKLRALLASIPYDTAPRDDIELRERDYQIAVYLVFALMGLFTQTEVQSTTGRADCVVVTPKFIYVFKFKLWSAGSAEEALQQIRDKGYATKYEATGKELILVGASFDEEKRNIKDWAVQRSGDR